MKIKGVCRWYVGINVYVFYLFYFFIIIFTMYQCQKMKIKGVCVGGVSVSMCMYVGVLYLFILLLLLLLFKPYPSYQYHNQSPCHLSVDYPNHDIVRVDVEAVQLQQHNDVVASQQQHGQSEHLLFVVV